MNRRSFFATVFIAPFIAKTIPWVHKPSKKEIQAVWQLQEAMNQMNNQIDASIFGIPYHQSNASTGTWMGFERK